MEEDEKSIETDTKLNRPRKKKRSAIHKVESLEISGTKKVIIQGTNKEHTVRGSVIKLCKIESMFFFQEYIIHVVLKGHPMGYYVSRRYSSFLELDNEISDLSDHTSPSSHLPSKTVFSSPLSDKFLFCENFDLLPHHH